MVNVFKIKKMTTICIVLAAAWLAGCAHIPSDRDQLPRRDGAAAELAADIKLARDGWPDARWWTMYGDAQLDKLIDQALRDSPNVKLAATRISSAQAALASDRAEVGLQTELAAAANRQRYSGNGLLPAPIGGNYFNEQTLQARAQYVFDWWGKNRAQIAAAIGEINATRADYAQAEQALAAAVAQSYFNLQGDWARQANAEQIAAAQQALVADKVKRIAHGLATSDEQNLAQLDLAAIEKQVALLTAESIRERESLRALVGGDASALADLQPRPINDAPHALPGRLGYELLARRPDLQAARWHVQASLSRVEATEAAFYPDINLSASMGLDSISLSRLFEFASRTLFIGPTLSLPLFDSKRLDARLGSARAARNELIANYNLTVFNAVREVAQGAAGLQGLENQIKQQEAASAASNALLHSAQARFKQGLIGRSTLLAAELAALKQQDLSLQLHNQELLAEVALTKALGGGYQNGSSATGLPLAHQQNTTEK
jgi:multidrug efflux system outer membrane protein